MDVSYDQFDAAPIDADEPVPSDTFGEGTRDGPERPLSFTPWSVALESLPDDIMRAMLSLLLPRDRLRLQSVSRKLRLRPMTGWKRPARDWVNYWVSLPHMQPAPASTVSPLWPAVFGTSSAYSCR